jgi:hypothetical protein
MSTQSTPRFADPLSFAHRGLLVGGGVGKIPGPCARASGPLSSGKASRGIFKALLLAQPPSAPRNHEGCTGPVFCTDRTMDRETPPPFHWAGV